MVKKASTKFPKTIFVTREENGDGSVFYVVRLPEEDFDDLAASQVAAVYDLASQGIISVRREFQHGKK